MAPDDDDVTRVAQQDEARFLPGAILAERYRIVSLLGRGGMGEVYRADDLKLGQPVALKFLPPALEQNPSYLSRFINEVRAALRVTHPNVCRVYDVAVADRRHFLSMEYVDGENLSSLLRRIGRLPSAKANELGQQLCAGVAAVHEEGILHRDLKPANIMIDGRGRARITDFGLAGMAGQFTDLDATAGTPGYMAPEQLDGKDASVRSDLYALGAVLYEMYTGERAFRAHSLDELREAQRRPPASPANLVPDLDPASARVILNCLDPDPVNRPRSAAAIAATLPRHDPLAAAAAASETPSPEVVAAAATATPLRPAVALGLSVLGVLLFAGGTVLNGRHMLVRYLPFDLPPEALVDRSRDIIARLGYDAPLYTAPADHAVYYGVDMRALEAFEAGNVTPNRWSGLRVQSDLVRLGYRQSPRTLVPVWPKFMTFVAPYVSAWDPYPDVAGEIGVVLDGRRRLTLFYCIRPPTSSSARASSDEPPWSALFDLAGFREDEFRRVPAQYQRYPTNGERTAWVGRVAEEGNAEVRIEAAFLNGRAVFFDVLSAEAIRQLNEVRPPGSDRLRGLAFDLVGLACIIVAFLFARRNIQRARTDRNATIRLAIVAFVVVLVWGLFAIHGLYTVDGHWRIFPLLGTALFYAALTALVYLAIEPSGRRIYPSMFIAWSRLVSGAKPKFKDPVIGRAVLAGLLVGGALTLLPAVGYAAATIIQGVPPRPFISRSDIWSGAPALPEIILVAWFASIEAFFFAFMVVAARFFLRRQGLVVAAVLLLSVIADQPRSVGFVFGSIVSSGLLIWVLIRFGLLAVVVSFVVERVGLIMPAATWRAWYAETAVLAIALLACLAAFAYWAASSGRSFVPDEAA